VSILSQFESAFEEKFYNERLEKLAQIRALGVKAGLTAAEAIYPNNFRFNTDVPQIRSAYDATSAEQLEADKPSVAIAGRLVAIRLQGKAGFAQLQQGGQRLQVYVRKDNVGEDAFELYRLLDLGDHVGVEGPLFRTRTGELTVQVQKLTFLTKAMLPLPDKHAGLGDIELRYRRRYLDLFTDTGDVAETPSGVAAASEAAGLSVRKCGGLRSRRQCRGNRTERNNKSVISTGERHLQSVISTGALHLQSVISTGA
jgi:lysyl-tRNA synthetase class 2